jgi:4a-hydroxytetrahydrobiopterin dehydratase
MSDLATKSCVPCAKGTLPLRGEALQSHLQELDGWSAVEGHHLHKEFKFPDFVTALAFVNRIGEVAEREQHHPDLLLTWGKVRVEIWTHSIDGLSESDFVLAAKIDRLPRD